ncbi:GAF and ANTAR domain-containing protein [Microbacteriaceae bacterium VKM Ac-2855]|nr:GAF and ANTAR domain-containing protein [Microbacteriaceae bacterium VKM Ac-2855]
MVTRSREQQLVETFVTLADSLVDDYDVVDLLQGLVERCVTIFGVRAAGIVLADADGQLEVIASSNEDARLIELMQLSAGSGPCIESFSTGEVVVVPDAASVVGSWSDYSELSSRLGLTTAYCVPMRLRSRIIGSLNLFGAESDAIHEDDAAAARALADVATIGILHQRAIAESDLIRLQLQRALDSRIVIEQAKGVIAFTHRVDVEQAFAILRGHARSTSTPLTTVAEQVVRFDLEL